MASIEHRVTASGDVWRVRFRHDGGQKVITFSDRPNAEKWRALADVDVEAALRLLEPVASPPSVPTVSEWVATHIETLTGVTDGTRRSYRSQLTHHIDPHPIGMVRVDALTQADVAGWVNWLEKDRGLAGKSIANSHGLLSHAMTTAVVAHHASANPSRGMRLPRTASIDGDGEHVYLTRDEFERLHALLPERSRPLVLLLVGTGMRLGEATALRVSDVDPDTKSIHVRRAFKRTGKAKAELGATKSGRSTRTVAAPAQVIEAIRPLMDGRHPSELLFQNTRGGEIRQSPFWNRVWKPAVLAFAGDVWEWREDNRGRPDVLFVLERGPGKHPRIHDLRHTFASWAIQNGVPLPVIQRQLGHESITTTIDTYGHLARADFDALASATATMLPPMLTNA